MPGFFDDFSAVGEGGVESGLLHLFQAKNLDYGKALLNYFNERNALEPKSLASITTNHIKSYLMARNPEYVTVDPGGSSTISVAKLERCLSMLRLHALVPLVHNKHAQNIILAQIRNKRIEKGASSAETDTVLCNPRAHFTYLESLDDEELGALYTAIINKLLQVRSTNQTTNDALEQVLSGNKPKELSDVLLDGYNTMMQRHGAPYLQQTTKQHADAIKQNPGMQLLEQDFLLNPVPTYKKVLTDALQALKVAEDKDDAMTSGNWAEFNKIFRNLLVTDYQNQADKNKFEAKFKFALNKLAIVLRRNSCQDTADKIMQSIRGPGVNRAKIPTPIKKDLLELQNGNINAQAVTKVAELFNKCKSYVKQLLVDNSLPDTVKQIRNSNLVQPQIDQFTDQVDLAQDTRARLKFTARCIKVATALENLYGDGYTRDQLSATQVSDAEIAHIEALAPRSDLLTQFSNHCQKLGERTNLAGSDDKQYFRPATPAEKLNNLKHMQHEINLRCRTLDALLAGLDAQILQDRSANKHMEVALLEIKRNYVSDKRSLLRQVELDVVEHIRNVAIISPQQMVAISDQFKAWQTIKLETNKVLNDQNPATASPQPTII